MSILSLPFVAGPSLQDIPSKHGGRKRTRDHDGGVSDTHPEQESGLRVREERVEGEREDCPRRQVKLPVSKEPAQLICT